MATIALCVTNHTGHLHATYKMASDLRAQGHRVVYWTGEAGAERAASWGFESEVVPFLGLREGAPLQLSWRRPLGEQLRAANQRARVFERALEAVPAAAFALNARWRPSLIVFDPFLLCFYPAFFALHIPAAALSTKPLLDDDPLVPPYTSGIVPGRRWTRRAQIWLARGYWRTRALGYTGLCALQDRLGGASAHSVWRELSRSAHFPIERARMVRPVVFDFCLRNIPELVLGARELELPRSKPVRSQVHYLGPCVALQRPESSWRWDSLQLRRYLVLCSLGTVEGGRNRTALRFIRRVMAAFSGDEHVSLIVSTGSDSLAEQLRREASPNVHVFAAVPQLEILARARVMITHGGSNSLKECICSGVPPLVYPGQADQPGNAARVVYHGIGLRGSRRRDSARTVRHKVMQLIHDRSAHDRLAHMRTCFLSYPNVELERLLEYARAAAAGLDCELHRASDVPAAGEGLDRVRPVSGPRAETSPTHHRNVLHRSVHQLLRSK